MFVVMADGHGSPSDPATRHDRFSAVSYSHAIALHARSGSVVLHPEDLHLNVGADSDCYGRVRIFAAGGVLIGAMSLCIDGRVSWVESVAP